jgi:hypothetical protein
VPPRHASSIAELRGDPVLSWRTPRPLRQPVARSFHLGTSEYWLAWSSWIGMSSAPASERMRMCVWRNRRLRCPAIATSSGVTRPPSRSAAAHLGSNPQGAPHPYRLIEHLQVLERAADRAVERHPASGSPHDGGGGARTMRPGPGRGVGRPPGTHRRGRAVQVGAEGGRRSPARRPRRRAPDRRARPALGLHAKSR